MESSRSVYIARPLLVAGVHEVLAVAGRAAEVDLHADVAAIGEPLRGQVETPGIASPWAAMHKQDGRQVLALRLRRKSDVALQSRPVARVEREALHWRELVVVELGAVAEREPQVACRPVVDGVPRRSVGWPVSDQPQPVGALGSDHAEPPVVFPAAAPGRRAALGRARRTSGGPRARLRPAARASREATRQTRRSGRFARAFLGAACESRRISRVVLLSSELSSSIAWPSRVKPRTSVFAESACGISRYGVHSPLSSRVNSVTLPSASAMAAPPRTCRSLSTSQSAKPGCPRSFPSRRWKYRGGRRRAAAGYRRSDR